MRESINLNFDWKYSESFNEDMIAANFDDSTFEAVNIPHCNKEIPYNYFDEKMYQFVSCYRKSFRLPKSAFESGKHIYINFEGAANYSKVYVNGKFAGEHKGGYTPFSFDITELVNKKTNVVTVVLDSTERSEIPPFGFIVDYLCYGGIYREVHLEIRDEKYIEDVFVTTPNCLRADKIIETQISFNESVEGMCTLELLDGEKVIAKKTADIKGKVIKTRWKVKNVELWDIDSPKLYNLRVSFGSDVFVRRFGFREARFTRTGFMLNGRKLKLVGLNRHQSYPYVGNAMPASAQKADAELLKYKLGCNIVRTAHYPDSVHFLERCDEIGLLVFTEMPSWQHLGEGEWRENCLENIRRMVIRDRSHPSVVLWGIRVNEGNDCDEFYTDTNALARSLDPSRQTGGVRNMPRSHLLEDVYTYNDFSHTGGFIKLLPPALVTGFKAPYLVTEYNGHVYPTKSFDREELRREVALRHLRVQNHSFGNKRFSGAIAWCMADYNTHKDFGSGDRICYHGVTDMFRIPKISASVYASQQEDIPVLEPSSSMDVGEYPGAIIGQIYLFTNCDYVKIYKNGEYKSTAYPDTKKYANIPNPPVLPADYIGNSLVTEDGLDEKAAAALKNALVAAAKYGYIMPPQHYLEIAYAFLKGKMTITQIVNLITKYFANWGDEQVTYRFDGYKDGQMVKSVTRTAVMAKSLVAKADSAELVEDETYDVTRIELLAVDQNGNRLAFANDTVKVTVDGPAKVIGPDNFALIGGGRAFWIKTIGKSGKITVTVESEDLGKQVLEFTAVKK